MDEGKGNGTYIVHSICQNPIRFSMFLRVYPFLDKINFDKFYRRPWERKGLGRKSVQSMTNRKGEGDQV